MASIERTPKDESKPATRYAVKWRLGGKRNGAPQTLTFVVPPGARPTATLKLAEAARQLAESRGHAITRAQVSSAVLGETPSTPVDVPTFADWVSQYVETRARLGDIQPDVLKRDQISLVKHAVPKLGTLYLTEINREMISEWLAWLKTRRKANGDLLSPKYIRNIHATLHTCLAAAVPRWMPDNPVARPAGSRRSNPALPKVIPHQGIFLEPWELSTILGNSTDDFRDMVEVDVRTGLRLGELLVLRPSDVVLGGKRPHIKVVRALKTDGTIGPPKSAKSVRDVPVSTRIAGLLDRLASGKRPNELIFSAPRGGMWAEKNLRNRRWIPAVAASRRCAEHPPPLPPKPQQGPRRQWQSDEVSTCGCPNVLRRVPRFHDLRHTHVSLLIAKGWMPKEIQVRMGHASIVVTMDIYGHLWETPAIGRLDEVDELLSGTPERDVTELDELDELAADTGRLAREVRAALDAWRASRRQSSDRILRLVAADEAC